MSNNPLKVTPVENEPSLVREYGSNAILNVDKKEYTEYLKKRELFSNKKKKEQLVENRIDNLEKSIQEIKNVLQLLVEKLEG